MAKTHASKYETDIRGTSNKEIIILVIFQNILADFFKLRYTRNELKGKKIKLHNLQFFQNLKKIQNLQKSNNKKKAFSRKA